MVKERTAVDITTIPELARLAEEVRATGRPVRLRRNGEDIAVLSPAATRARRVGRSVTAADMAAAERAFGGWRGIVDAEELKRVLRDLQVDQSPPITL